MWTAVYLLVAGAPAGAGSSIARPSSIAALSLSSFSESIASLILWPGFAAKNRAYSFSIASRPLNFVPESSVQSPSAVQCAATPLASPLLNAATNASAAARMAAASPLAASCACFGLASDGLVAGCWATTAPAAKTQQNAKPYRTAQDRWIMM
jgi:hypothetical protein